MIVERNLVELLPHAPPMLMLELARRCGDRSIVAHQRIPTEHDTLRGHFPDFPMWPGSLLLEAMAQCTAVYLLAERPLGSDEMPVLGAVDGRFLLPVFPGDRLEYRVRLVRRIGDAGLFAVTATRGGAVVARARISAGLVPRTQLREERGE